MVFYIFPATLLCGIYYIREYLLQLFDVSFSWGRVGWLAAVDISKIDIEFNSVSIRFQYQDTFTGRRIEYCSWMQPSLYSSRDTGSPAWAIVMFLSPIKCLYSDITSRPLHSWPFIHKSTTSNLNTDSHIACRAHAAPMLFSCHAVPLRV